MTTSRIAARTGAALAVAITLGVLGAPQAAAHVHGINPLRCTPAAPNAGALQTNDTPAPTASQGAVTGVIPITNGGSVPLFGGGRDAAVCDR